ncbi:MAG: hypothetical protein PSN37_01345 [Alphaproteobacteria bacterium]|nr:hypothetical protein [Alphaproteobacteria bacterium]
MVAFGMGIKTVRNSDCPKQMWIFGKQKLNQTLKGMNGTEEVCLPMGINIGKCGNASCKTVTSQSWMPLSTFIERLEVLFDY